ncbi:hypothetical protein ARMGADRAFT_1085870 [Armillaria gallica]|uniref:Uncharacterized protein n=1 Tax=Armillaria gallica TaxID=47427 RepID=A0A2H3D041_ARMGA|nr:hypothetical protein ARMGADRAFT_1085870 [Armillaria gallica]
MSLEAGVNIEPFPHGNHIFMRRTQRHIGGVVVIDIKRSEELKQVTSVHANTAWELAKYEIPYEMNEHIRQLLAESQPIPRTRCGLATREKHSNSLCSWTSKLFSPCNSRDDALGFLYYDSLPTPPPSLLVPNIFYSAATKEVSYPDTQFKGAHSLSSSTYN